MVAVHIYVEGGGDSKALRTRCREGFRCLIERAGLLGSMPRISASGSRRAAYDDYCTALSSGAAFPLLLVDAEAAVTQGSPWTHVRNRVGDGWEKPPGASDAHLHLMVQCMEAWFLADRAAMGRFFGDGFREGALPAETAPTEDVAKVDLYRRLEAATRACAAKGAYRKAEHSFSLLAALDPRRLRGASPWAERFFATLERLLKPAVEP